jgi:formate hydrogenlyase transcriptional activator
MVHEREFRADLFYRLSVFPIELPPLRERPEDIPSLVHHFAMAYAARMRKPIEHIPDDVMTALVRYEWPGNIRELQNFIERSVILTRGAELRAPITELVNQETPNGVLRTLADAERAHIIATLRQTNGVVGGPNGAAAKLGLKRTTLLAKMRNLGISKGTVSWAPAQ